MKNYKTSMVKLLLLKITKSVIINWVGRVWISKGIIEQIKKYKLNAWILRRRP